LPVGGCSAMNWGRTRHRWEVRASRRAGHAPVLASRPTTARRRQGGNSAGEGTSGFGPSACRLGTRAAGHGSGGSQSKRPGRPPLHQPQFRPDMHPPETTQPQSQGTTTRTPRGSEQPTSGESATGPRATLAAPSISPARAPFPRSEGHASTTDTSGCPRTSVRLAAIAASHPSFACATALLKEFA
jgi:hypothetical protein